MRQRSRGHDRRVLDADLVVGLVTLLQPAQDRDRILHVGLAHVDDLEAPLERRVLLDVLAIFVQRGRADRAQAASGERRLQHVRGIHRALARARADQRMQLVDEQDDLAVRLLDLLQDSLKAFFELSPKLRTGDERAEVERTHPLVLQDLRHVAEEDAPREALDDRGLAHARLADQHRVVLGPAREHLHHAANLLVAADDGVELAAAGELGQILGILFERLELALGRLVGHAGVAAHRGQRLQDRGVIGPKGLQRGRDGPAALLGERE